MMKKFILIAVIGLAAVSCGGRHSDTRAEKMNRKPDMVLEDKISIDKTRTCGGYTEQRELTEEEMGMFRIVTAKSPIFYTPLSVSTQVVAGKNYKFWCRYQDDTGNASGHCWIVIYEDLKGNCTLKSISNEIQ